MQHLDLYDVLAVAARVLDCESVDAIRRTDLELVGQILDDVRSTQGDLADAAAVLLSGLLRRRPFTGPNRVVAVAITLQLVAVNGADLELEPAKDFDGWLDQVKAGALSTSVFADRLRSRLAGDQAVNISTFGDEGISWEEIGMFERFSERARRVTVLAQEEAGGFNHNFVGTEHLLLGLIRESDGVAARALANLGISAPAVRSVVENLIGRGQSKDFVSGGHISFTPRAKRVLELSLRESLNLGHNYIGTEHILLGLIREGEGVAAQALTKLGVDLETARQQVIEILSPGRQSVDDVLSPSRLSEEGVRDLLSEGSDYPADKFWYGTGRRRHLLRELAGLVDENERLHEETTRLRAKLHDHGINPD
ncbi:MAG TPA: Clp protease N-terminal domain-containing protein, partial [Kribbella sp.]|uniref:Clp protease N-terminal domain-containing protein n=1 Tax=Kribbella sp. TaxID=1871183 RepID=UPI002D79C4B3